MNDLQQRAYVNVVDFRNRNIHEGLSVEDLESIFPNDFELHDYNIVLDILEVRVLCVHCLACIDWVTSEHVFNLLLMLTLDQELVPVVSFLVDTIEVMGVLDRHKLRD